MPSHGRECWTGLSGSPACATSRSCGNQAKISLAFPAHRQPEEETSMATKIIDVTYRFCGQWKDTHEAHLIYDGTTPTDLCPGTEGSGASMVSELVTALKALPALWLRLDEWTHGIREERAEWLRTFLVATQNAQALLDRLKTTPTA